MAVPSGYTPLAKVGMVNKGTYSASATYNSLDFVYYNGSSYVAKKDGLTGVTPAEGVNWQYLAKGFVNADATGINIKDTSNLMGSGAGKAVTLQTWGDKVADWLVSKVITNDNFVTKLTERLVNNGTTTSTGFALDARYGKTLQDAVSQLNADVPNMWKKVSKTCSINNNYGTLNSWWNTPFVVGKILFAPISLQLTADLPEGTSLVWINDIAINDMSITFDSKGNGWQCDASKPNNITNVSYIKANTTCEFMMIASVM